VEETDAMQHLRSNELRDHINEVIFRYLTTITPYFRLVSWLVWIYTRLDLERKTSEDGMRVREYKEKASRYYGIFATADTLHARFSGIEHHGPVGVEAINRALDQLDGETIDFRYPSFGSPTNPTGAYANAIINMGLLNRMLQPVTVRREEVILIPTERGRQLASAFQNSWNDLFSSDALVEKLVWTQRELLQLGEVVCLQGLSSDQEEATLLLQSARSSLKDPALFDGFVDIALTVAKEYERSDSMFRAEDVGRAALYWGIRKNHSFKRVQIPNSGATALIAYHELHTHASYGADAILGGITMLAASYPGGIPLSTIVDEAAKLLNNDSVWRHTRRVQDAINNLKESFSPGPKKFHHMTPLPEGPYGFETVQDRIDASGEEAPALVAWGGIALFQAACAQELFEKDWLRRILPYHREVFASYTFLEELQALPSSATIKDWLERVVKRIIEQHSAVAESKGSYARRIERVDNFVYYRADAGYDRIRGRLGNAIAWLSEAGLLRRQGSEYKMALETT